MSSRKSKPDAMDAFVLRSYVLSLVDTFQQAGPAKAPWNNREEGIVLIEEILLEGRAVGFETREGFEELCKTVLAFQIKLPFSKQVRQALQRPGQSELQRVEGLRLSVMNHRKDTGLTRLPHASRN